MATIKFRDKKNECIWGKDRRSAVHHEILNRGINGITESLSICLTWYPIDLLTDCFGGIMLLATH